MNVEGGATREELDEIVRPCQSVLACCHRGAQPGIAFDISDDGLGGPSAPSAAYFLEESYCEQSSISSDRRRYNESHERRNRQAPVECCCSREVGSLWPIVLIKTVFTPWKTVGGAEAEPRISPARLEREGERFDVALDESGGTISRALLAQPGSWRGVTMCVDCTWNESENGALQAGVEAARWLAEVSGGTGHVQSDQSFDAK